MFLSFFPNIVWALVAVCNGASDNTLSNEFIHGTGGYDMIGLFEDGRLMTLFCSYCF